MDRATRTDRVTPNLAGQAKNLVRIVDKKHLCEHLGWSRPALDRRLQSDKNFPVLHCGKTGDPWQFNLSAVLTHLQVGAAYRRRPSCAPGGRAQLSGDARDELRLELAKVRALRRAVEALLAEIAAVASGGSTVERDRRGE
ncbi:hypothetical protein GCM10027093_58980 [Paraburkholderia jirisanensis]